MPGREGDVEDSGEHGPAKSASRWLPNAIKPAAPPGESFLPAARAAPEKPAALTDLGPTTRNGPVAFALLFHVALLRGRISS